MDLKDWEREDIEELMSLQGHTYIMHDGPIERYRPMDMTGAKTADEDTSRPQKFNEMMPHEITNAFLEYREMGLIPNEFEYVVVYDVDYDMVKLRFWKQAGDVLVTRKWSLPSFPNSDALLAWLSGRLTEFGEMTDNVEPEYVKGSGYLQSTDPTL